jgi:hypothetical protein
MHRLCCDGVAKAEEEEKKRGRESKLKKKTERMKTAHRILLKMLE